MLSRLSAPWSLLKTKFLLLKGFELLHIDIRRLVQHTDSDIEPSPEVLRLCCCHDEAGKGRSAVFCTLQVCRCTCAHWPSSSASLGCHHALTAPLRLSASALPCRSQEATEEAEAELLRTGALQGGPLETICEERPPSLDTVRSSSLQELQPGGEADGCRVCSLVALLHSWSTAIGR